MVEPNRIAMANGAATGSIDGSSDGPNGAPPANLRLRLYLQARQLGWSLRRRWPAALVAPRRDLAGAFAIGITTYRERYTPYFLPLYRRLSHLFPEVPLVVAVNGHGSVDEQRAFLQRFEVEICQGAPSHHRFLLHEHPHGLTTLWNGLLAAAPGGQPLLILNDDLRVHGWLRRWAEAFAWGTVTLDLLNSSWSHFIIAPATVARVGAFDPGFPGIGFEDMDYTARATLAGVSIANHLCGYLRHDDHRPESTSFDNRSGRVWGKYTSANQEHFASQWERCGPEEGVYIKQLHHHVRPRRAVHPFAVPPLPLPSCPGPALYPDRCP